MKLYIVFCELMSRLHTYYYSKFHRYSIGAGSVVFYKALIIGDSKSVSIGRNCLIGRTSINYHGGKPYHTRILCDGVNSCVVIGAGCVVSGTVPPNSIVRPAADVISHLSI